MTNSLRFQPPCFWGRRGVEYFQTKIGGTNNEATVLARICLCINNVDTVEETEAMETIIRKWGNSPALRLPTAVLKEAGYQLEQKVDLVVSRGRIIIQPSKKVEYDLDALVNGIHAGNTHDEVSFGRPVGNEAL